MLYNVTLDECFGVSYKDCVTVIGTGGKTSLIKYLARKKRHLKTLITTTTKMAPLNDEKRFYDYFWDYSFLEKNFPDPSLGITLTGIVDKDTGKLTSLPIDALEGLVSYFDCVFIEGDGSRGLPLKAWRVYEPVVISSTTITVGVLPLWTLGMVISEKIIHCLPLFMNLVDAREGEVLTLDHLVKVITGENAKGLFASACGKRILFFNQVESYSSFLQVKELVSLLPEVFLSGLYKIIVGSVYEEKGAVLWECGRFIKTMH